MIIEETNLIELPKTENYAIYFLTKDNDVVYVGQTTRGATRPYEHTDKDYDKIYMKYCEKKDLDRLEDAYILKYRPIYNKACNNAIRYGLKKTLERIRKELKIKLDLCDLEEIIKKLNIETTQTSDYQTITIFQFYDILNYLKGEIDDRE